MRLVPLVLAVSVLVGAIPAAQASCSLLQTCATAYAGEDQRIAGSVIYYKYRGTGSHSGLPLLSVLGITTLTVAGTTFQGVCTGTQSCGSATRNSAELPVRQCATVEAETYAIDHWADVATVGDCTDQSSLIALVEETARDLTATP